MRVSSGLSRLPGKFRDLRIAAPLKHGWKYDGEGYGLELKTAQKEQVIRYLLDSEVPFARRVDRPGWHGALWVFPDTTIGTSSEQVVYSGMSSVAAKFGAAGTLAMWQEQIGRYCVGNSRLLLSVSAAFAAPLLSLTNWIRKVRAALQSLAYCPGEPLPFAVRLDRSGAGPLPANTHYFFVRSVLNRTLAFFARFLAAFVKVESVITHASSAA